MYFARATGNVRKSKLENHFARDGKKKGRNEYTRCQFHLVLYAVNRTINHSCTRKDLPFRHMDRTMGITRNLYLAHLCEVC